MSKFKGLRKDCFPLCTLLHNFLSPTLKLAEKVRIGAKTNRKYERPKTPCQRLLQSAHFTAEEKAALEASFRDPIR